VIRSSRRLDTEYLSLGLYKVISSYHTTYPNTLYTMSESRENVHNFAAGPSPLPTPVLQKAAEGLLNYNGTGMGVCELSHRGKDFKAIIEGAEGKLAVV
jgi:hypothetical protein